MSDKTIFSGGEDGQTSVEEVPSDDYAVWITGLTKAQYDGLVEALSPAGKPLGRTTRLALRFSMTMVFVAGCLWVVAAIITNLPGR